jgi:hypothetical protein
MPFSELMSLTAVVIALGSLVVSFWVSWGDRPKLKVSTQFYPGFEDAPPKFRVWAVNAGKRPIILRLLGGDHEDGWSGTYLGESGKGLRLGENEFFEDNISPGHNIFIHPGGSRLVRMWFEDSLGRRYPVPRSEQYIAALLAIGDAGGGA